MLAFPDVPGEVIFLLQGALTFLAITASVFAARRLLDRRSIASLGLAWNRRSLRDLAFGFLLAGLLMGLVYLIEWAAGWLQFEGFAWQLDPWPVVIGWVMAMFFAFILVGWQEELLARGYWLQNIREGLDLTWAVSISSGLFALAHFANPNANLQAVIGLAVAGLFLAYGYLRTRQLWLPIGLHTGWNFFEGPVFGFPVSGLESFRLIRHQVDGPEILTGGAFGPEAGLVILPVLLLGSLLIYLYSRNHPEPI
jgi:membrane protease YdiL (CAAX protease family)